jgi:hypothetical protein
VIFFIKVNGSKEEVLHPALNKNVRNIINRSTPEEIKIRLGDYVYYLSPYKTFTMNDIFRYISEIIGARTLIYPILLNSHEFSCEIKRVFSLSESELKSEMVLKALEK